MLFIRAAARWHDGARRRRNSRAPAAASRPTCIFRRLGNHRRLVGRKFPALALRCRRGGRACASGRARGKSPIGETRRRKWRRRWACLFAACPASFADDMPSERSAAPSRLAASATRRGGAAHRSIKRADEKLIALQVMAKPLADAHDGSSAAHQHRRRRSPARAANRRSIGARKLAPPYHGAAHAGGAASWREKIIHVIAWRGGCAAAHQWWLAPPLSLLVNRPSNDEAWYHLCCDLKATSGGTNGLIKHRRLKLEAKGDSYFLRISMYIERRNSIGDTEFC